MPRDDGYDDPDDRPRRRRRGPRGVPCPECGSEYQRPGPWPWYLGTVGMMFCKAVVCEDCGHHFENRFTYRAAENPGIPGENANRPRFTGAATVVG